ncbi:hypothetical protein FRC12_000793 [Ceratobasidium sp. 428]|nr:hypothetical protein FRC12_000793 [Ceratobasidium sp. 428]
MVSLPLELVRHIAEFCPTSELCSLVLLNRYCYDSMISSLYSNIKLNSWENLVNFCRTVILGRHPFHLYPQSLHISIKGARSEWCFNGDIEQDIRETLLLLQNVLVLILDFPTGDFPAVFSDARNRRIPPRQTTLEKFPLLDRLQNDHLTETPVPTVPDILPRLQSLTSTGFYLINLVPRRPVTDITLTDDTKPAHIPAMASTLACASKPLLSLDVFVHVRHARDCLIYLGRWLSKISCSYKSFEAITFRVSLVGGFFEYTPPTGIFYVEVAPDDFCASLSRFEALRSFGISLVADPRAFQALWFNVPELSDLASWQTFCPSLNHVSLFGKILAAE